VAGKSRKKAAAGKSALMRVPKSLRVFMRRPTRAILPKVNVDENQWVAASLLPGRGDMGRPLAFPPLECL
jgi:hypothetical protein